MILTMPRGHSAEGATISSLFLGNDFICDILEDQVREVKGTPVAEWKVHGATAIPAGTYEIVLEDSPRFGPDTLTLRNVPGYVAIRIHAGNDKDDTEGCLLPGIRLNPTTVTKSRMHLQKLRDLVLPAIEAGERVFIEIFNALESA